MLLQAFSIQSAYLKQAAFEVLSNAPIKAQAKKHNVSFSTKRTLALVMDVQYKAALVVTVLIKPAAIEPVESYVAKLQARQAGTFSMSLKLDQQKNLPILRCVYLLSLHLIKGAMCCNLSIQVAIVLLLLLLLNLVSLIQHKETKAQSIPGFKSDRDNHLETKCINKYI